MKFMKKNRPDVMIILLLILWGIYEIFVVPLSLIHISERPVITGYLRCSRCEWCHHHHHQESKRRTDTG